MVYQQKWRGYLWKPVNYIQSDGDVRPWRAESNRWIEGCRIQTLTTMTTVVIVWVVGSYITLIALISIRTQNISEYCGEVVIDIKDIMIMTDVQAYLWIMSVGPLNLGIDREESHRAAVKVKLFNFVDFFLYFRAIFGQFYYFKAIFSQTLHQMSP